MVAHRAHFFDPLERADRYPNRTPRLAQKANLIANTTDGHRFTNSNGSIEFF
jgi:hypothetical protein